MDFENRVVRLDSFSKIVSAGLRLGFVTGPLKVLEKMVLHIESSSIHPSNVSQVCSTKSTFSATTSDFFSFVNNVLTLSSRTFLS